MTPSFKTQFMVCLVFIACNAPAVQAGFFEDLFSVFRLPPPAAPATPQPAPPPAEAPEPAQPVTPPQPAMEIVNPPTNLPQPATQPTIQTDPSPPGPPTQDELDEMLWLAALQGNTGRIRNLVEQGANPLSATPHGETPLHVAASRGHLKPIIYLANHGGSVNARTRNGWTPLHHAARFGHIQAVKYLLHMGAIPHIRTNDKGRKSPMEMAVDNGYIDIAVLLGYRPR